MAENGRDRLEHVHTKIDPSTANTQSMRKEIWAHLRNSQWRIQRGRHLHRTFAYSALGHFEHHRAVGRYERLSLFLNVECLASPI